MIKATVRTNKKYIYEIEYAVSNNMEGWNGVRRTSIETKHELTQEDMIKHIRKIPIGHIGIYATITLMSCIIKEVKTKKLF